MEIASQYLLIHLFGPLEVVDGQRPPVVLHRSTTGALLAYLALYASRAHSREFLAEVLWPDEDPQVVRNRLRQRIFALKRLLQEGGLDADRLLAGDRNTLSLHSHVTTDLQCYHHTLERAKSTTDAVEKITLLQQAVSIFHSPLLADFDDSWVLTERSILNIQHTKIGVELAHLQEAQGDLSAAIQTMRSLLALDALREETHLELMRLHARMGEPSRVLMQYQELERELREAFDIAPSEATQHMLKTLRQQAAANAADALTVFSAPVPSPDKAILSNVEPVSVSARTEVDNKDASVPHSVASGNGTNGRIAVELPARRTPRKLPERLHAVWVRRNWKAALGVLLAVTAGWGWFRFQRSSALRLAWEVEFHAQLGEKENSEPRAVVTDAKGNVYVCGFTQTEHEDVDILVLKYSSAGKLLWSNRYSSPEHDCDRAFDLLVDHDGVYVVGETYVPERPGEHGGWKLLTLKYDATNGAELWWRRSPMFTDIRERVRVVPDGRGGIYVGGTALEGKDKTSALVLQYNARGDLLLKYHSPSESRFYDMVAMDKEGVAVFGEKRLTDHRSGTLYKSMVVRLSFTGQVVWENMLAVAGEQGNGVGAGRIVMDTDGNLYLAGIETTAQTIIPSVQAFWVAKIGVSGGLLWKQKLAQKGFQLKINDLAVATGQVYVGGRIIAPDHTERMAAIAYDLAGRRQWSYSVTRYRDNRSTGKPYIALLDGRPIFGGWLFTPIADGKGLSNIKLSHCLWKNWLS